MANLNAGAISQDFPQIGVFDPAAASLNDMEWYGDLPPDPAAKLRREALRWAQMACVPTHPETSVETADESPSEAILQEDGESVAALGISRAPSAESSSIKETPVPERIPRWEPAFLAAYAQDGAVCKAADAAGINRRTVCYWKNKSRRFACLMEEAYERSVDLARQEIFNRGVVGWTEPVFYGGQVVGHLLKKSNACLLAYAKANCPEYRNKQTLANHVGAVPYRTEEEAERQASPYADASFVVLQSLADAENVRRGALLANPAPANPQPGEHIAT